MRGAVHQERPWPCWQKMEPKDREQSVRPEESARGDAAAPEERGPPAREPDASWPRRELRAPDLPAWRGRYRGQRDARAERNRVRERLARARPEWQLRQEQWQQAQWRVENWAVKRSAESESRAARLVSRAHWN